MPIKISELEWKAYVVSSLTELEAELPGDNGVHLSDIYERVEQKIQESVRIVNQNRNAKIRQTLGEGCSEEEAETEPKQLPLAFKKVSGRNATDGMWRLLREGE